MINNLINLNRNLNLNLNLNLPSFLPPFLKKTFSTIQTLNRAVLQFSRCLDVWLSQDGSGRSVARDKQGAIRLVGANR